MDSKKAIKSAPDSAGVYLMKDKNGAVIYIGKAASLRKRLASYFGKGRASYKTAVLMSSVAGIEYVTTDSEEEALLLEAALVKEKQPKFNVMLKDDKRYPLLKLTLNEKFPRLIVARRKKPDGAMYFGPYTSARLLRSALAVMRRIFPLRVCRAMPKTACLNYHINQCAAPCVDKVSRGGYRQIVDDIVLFLKGKKKELLENLSHRMKAAAEDKKFEEAARLRDQIYALSRISATKIINIDRLRKSALSGRLEIAQLQALLGMPRPPIRIEAFDVSNIGGKEAVGSMVAFFNGKPDKTNYRRFRIKGVSGIDDYKMLQEIINRRYERQLKEADVLPDLIIVDGGKGQLGVAKKALGELNLKDITVLGIAKKEERIFSLKGEVPAVKNSKALQLIQRVRDEAHRFAQSYHHIARANLTSRSRLDKIPGIGPKRKQALMRRFSSLNVIKGATINELREAVDARAAKAVKEHFNQ